MIGEKNNHKSTKLINVYMCFFSHMGGCVPIQIAYANETHRFMANELLYIYVN